MVQGSVLGPSSFIINASSLKPVHPLNKMIKFADDTYLVIPSSNSNSLQLDSLSEWAKLSNLSLNLKKSYKLIINNNYNEITPPSLHPSLQRTSSLTILGGSFTETLNITPHIDNIITKCYQTFHAPKIIRAHGLYGPKLYDITESLIISHIKYAAPFWRGFSYNQYIKQLQSLLKKLIILNFPPPNYPQIKAIFAPLDERLFSRVTSNPHHVLHQILPPVKSTSRDMRRPTHNYTKTIYSSFQHKTFLPRLLNTQ